ncbi:MAG: hypothetical protein J6U54_16365 [Clostridiales bacterium]|nr:hypothetical protein [Clostridiales bacterium]
MEDDENMIDEAVKEELENLLTATALSKREYEEDQEKFYSGLNDLNTDSGIVAHFVNVAKGILDAHDYSDDFYTCMKRIDSKL